MRSSDAILVGLLCTLAACSIGRDYIGSELAGNPDEQLVAGETTKREVLAVFGPPDRIVRQFDGDVFVYRYARTNSSSFTIEEPVFTDLELFTYEKVQKKSDLLVILFDRQGIVSGYGIRRGTEELEPY